MKQTVAKLIVVMVFIVLIGFVPNNSFGSSITLLPGETLEVRFYMPHPPSTLYHYDMFFLGSANATTIYWPVSSASTELYDGNTLLGTYSKSGDPLPAIFKTATSLWDNDQNPTIIDFSSFLDGSIDGLLRLSIQSGEVLIDLTKISIGIRWALSSNSTTYWEGDQPIISSMVHNTVPIPGAVWLLGSGLLGLIALRRKVVSNKS